MSNNLYFATVQFAFQADKNAADHVTEIFTNTLMKQNSILDWGYYWNKEKNDPFPPVQTTKEDVIKWQQQMDDNPTKITAAIQIAPSFNIAESVIVQDLLTRLSSLRKDAEMALSDEWDRSDEGFQSQIDLIDGLVNQYQLVLPENPWG